MKIGGLQKTSLIDFPGKLSCVIFTQGCNFRCRFCHNETLVLPERFQPTLSLEDILAFLKKRAGLLEGVVITGGEPTLHTDLIDIIKTIKDLGYAVKLDTNGTLPHRVAPLIEQKLVDYIAMDIKHELEHYDEITGVTVDTGAILESIQMIRSSGVDYEFRTTIVPAFHHDQTIKNIAQTLSGSKRYVLQEFLCEHAMDHTLLE